MGIVLLLGASIALFGLNFPLFRHGAEVAISAAGRVRSEGVYYQGAMPFGVFVAGDIGEDQNILKSLAQEYYGSGASVMTMDLSGHGSSVNALDTGKVPDDLVQEVRGGLDAFRRKSGLSDEAIVVVGHGYGARALLQIIVSDSPSFLGASLISPYILLDEKDGGSIYIKSQDDSKTGWISSLSQRSVSIPLQIIASENDDVVPYSSIQELYRRLTGSASFPILEKESVEKEDLKTRLYNTLVNGSAAKSDGASVTSGSVTLTLLPSGRHPYQMLSNSVISSSKIWAHSKGGMRSVSTTSIFPLLKVACWCMAAASLLLVSICSMVLAWSRYPGISRDRCGISLYPWRSLVIRLFVWAAGGAAGLLLWLLFLILPFGEPSGRLLPTAFIAGYGIALLVLYGLKKMPGASGSIQVFTGTLSLWRSATSIVMLSGLCVLVWFLGESGLFLTFFNSSRVFWIIVFTIVMTAAFYAFELDADVFTDNDGGLLIGILHRLVLILPFLLVCLFQWMAGSYASFFRLMCSLTALVICLNFSAAFHRHSGARVIPAIGTAFLYSMMVIPSAVLLA